MRPQDFEHRVEIEPIMTKHNEDAIQEWCRRHLGRYGETYFTYYSETNHKIIVYFKDSKDAVWFALRWA